MKLNQKSNATFYNRYPLIFMECTKIIKQPNKILSFGCSTGLECQALNKIYFKNSKIVGLDINKDIIAHNNKNNKIANIEYFDDIDKMTQLHYQFNLVFVMSVLCRWPEKEGDYTFDTFNETIYIINKLVVKNGYLCIYNSKFAFTDTTIFKQKYMIVDTINKDSGFVHKYTPNNKQKIMNYPHYLFKKIND